MSALSVDFGGVTLEQALGAFNGELSTVRREHVRATVEGFLAAADGSPMAEHAQLVRISLLSDRLRVEGTLARVAYPPTPSPLVSRRGLDLVDRLADRWGITDGDPSGFWFELNGP